MNEPTAVRYGSGGKLRERSAQAVYDDLRRRCQQEMETEMGGYAIVSALATLLGETIASAPVEQQAELHVIAADQIETSIARCRA